MKSKYQLSDFIWIFYPLIVAGLIVAGTKFLANSGLDSLSGLTVDQAQVEEDKRRVENLQNKLEILRTIDTESSKSQLESLLSAVPASRQVWLMINELKVIGQKSGMMLDRYKGTIGDVQEASESGEPATESATVEEDNGAMVLTVGYRLNNFEDLAKGLGTSEKLLPLVRIAKIDYSLEDVELTVEGAWSIWPPATNDPEQALVFNKDRIDRAVALLDGLETPKLDLLIAPVSSGSAETISSDLPED